jgi:hypothetical protein
MPEYVRPPIPEQAFHDDSGAIINYGHRWQGAGNTPPNEFYSVTAHPQRFSPLHLVADALIEHLRDTYEVSITEDTGLVNELNPRFGGGVLRAVQVLPPNADGAPLAIVFTGYPGIAVFAGLLHDFIIPHCGCDACDDDLDVLIEELEELVLAVAAGGFKESLTTNPDLPFRYDLRNPNGSGHGSSKVRTGSARENEALEKIRTLPNGWQPWLPREDIA